MEFFLLVFFHSNPHFGTSTYLHWRTNRRTYSIFDVSKVPVKSTYLVEINTLTWTSKTNKVHYCECTQYAYTIITSWRSEYIQQCTGTEWWLHCSVGGILSACLLHKAHSVFSCLIYGLRAGTILKCCI